MSKALGPTFGDEVHAAGLGGLPFSWGETDDTILDQGLTAEQVTTLDAVVAAHDPTKVRVPPAAPETQVLYDHENRVRALEGAPPLSLGDFLTKMRAPQ